MTESPRPRSRAHYVGLPTFMHCAAASTASELREMDANIAIIGAPVDMGVVARPGARFGPRAIREAGYFGSPNDRLYHMGLDVFPMEVLSVVDFGDANCPPNSLELSHEAVQLKVTEALEAGAMPLVLGGDHSITLPCATAVAQRYGFGSVGMVHFDAHADTGESSFGGVLVAHGTPMRRLIESGAIPGQNFVQVGLRGYWPDRQVFDWMRQQGMRWHPMEDIVHQGLDAVLEQSIREALEEATYLYLSVDIDVLDPAYAPAVATPEPGGLSAPELLRAVRRIAQGVPLVAMDVVEVSPPYDGQAAITAEVASRVVLEAMSAIAWRRIYPSR